MVNQPSTLMLTERASPLLTMRATLRRMKERQFIRRWRQFRGLTQEQLAERIGVSKSYVSKIEGGKKRYDQPFLEAAAVVLRCEPADLIMRDPIDTEAVWSLWDALNAPQRQAVIAVMESLKRTGTEG